MSTISWDWFNLSGKVFKMFGKYCKLWNLFNRNSTIGHHWGIGVLQIGHRHLFFVGTAGVSIVFFGRTR